MISVFILTKNEEQDLPGCLDSLSWCDDIHVFDSYSTDRTVEIATSFGAKVIQRNFDNWSAHQNWGLANIPFKYEWALYLDADERVPAELREILLAFVPLDQSAVAFEIRRKDFAWNGRWLKHAQMSPYYLRLFRPEKIRYERIVHPVPAVDGAVSRLSGFIDHYPFSKGFKPWWQRHLNYADLEALVYHENIKNDVNFSFKKALTSGFAERRYHLKGLFYKMPGRPFIKWLYLVIWRRAFLDGRAGITYATLQAIYEYFIVLKSRELANRKDSLNQ